MYSLFLAKEEETILEQIEMEKRDIERAKLKLAEIEAKAELRRKEEKNKLIAKIQAGEGTYKILKNYETIFRYYMRSYFFSIPIDFFIPLVLFLT